MHLVVPEELCVCFCGLYSGPANAEIHRWYLCSFHILYVGVLLWIPWQRSPFNSFFYYSWYFSKPCINNVSFMRTFILRLMTMSSLPPYRNHIERSRFFFFLLSWFYNLAKKKESLNVSLFLNSLVCSINLFVCL